MTTKYDDIDVDVEGKSKGEVIEAVIMAGSSYKDAEKYWKENGSRTVATGFRAAFYDRLKEGDMKRDDVKAMCKEEGSKNDAKAWTHYAAIADLIASIRSEG